MKIKIIATTENGQKIVLDEERIISDIGLQRLTIFLDQLEDSRDNDKIIEQKSMEADGGRDDFYHGQSAL